MTLEIAYPFVTQGAATRSRSMTAPSITTQWLLHSEPLAERLHHHDPGDDASIFRRQPDHHAEDYTTKHLGETTTVTVTRQGPGDRHRLRDHPPGLRPEEDQRLEADWNAHNQSGQRISIPDM